MAYAHFPMTATRFFRNAARNLALDSFYFFYYLRGAIPEALSLSRIQFLYLHEIPENEYSSFASLLAYLKKFHTFIGYSEAVDRILHGNIDKAFVTVSFDDGMKSCLTAAKFLSTVGISACFFVCPSVVGERSVEKLSKFCREKLYIHPTEFLSWEDIETILKLGHEVGNHSLNHYDLSQLTTQQLHDEIGASYEILRRQTGAVRHFSWPYGRFWHFSPSAAELVFSVGHVSCASAERGCHSHGETDPRNLCIRRDLISTSWPKRHIMYFLAKNSMHRSRRINGWPNDYLHIPETQCG